MLIEIQCKNYYDGLFLKTRVLINFWYGGLYEFISDPEADSLDRTIDEATISVCCSFVFNPQTMFNY